MSSGHQVEQVQSKVSYAALYSTPVDYLTIPRSVPARERARQVDMSGQAETHEARKKCGLAPRIPAQCRRPVRTHGLGLVNHARDVLIASDASRPTQLTARNPLPPAANRLPDGRHREPRTLLQAAGPGQDPNSFLFRFRPVLPFC